MRILESEYIHTGRVTICQIYAVWRGEWMAFTGVSIRHPEDKENREVGEALAWARANAKIQKRVERWANGQVKLADHNATLSHKAMPTPTAETSPFQDKRVWERQVPRYQNIVSTI